MLIALVNEYAFDVLVPVLLIINPVESAVVDPANPPVVILPPPNRFC